MVLHYREGASDYTFFDYTLSITVLPQIDDKQCYTQLKS